ncbi:hypothetical protein KI387_030828, partial [Taxus chinensis]
MLKPKNSPHIIVSRGQTKVIWEPIQGRMILKLNQWTDYGLTLVQKLANTCYSAGNS